MGRRDVLYKAERVIQDETSEYIGGNSMSMFCYQCQETAKDTGCEIKGICGKSEEVAKLQDLLIYTLKGISELVVKGKLNVKELGTINHEVLNSLFMTITNTNFDYAA